MRYLALCMLVACSQAFGLEQAIPHDAPAPPDGDGDGVADHEDNCPEHANENQHDEDGDARGDVCDNCPIVANTSNSDEGDRDGIGDACDPAPALAGDCMLLLETFLEPASFASHWMTITSEAAPRVEPMIDTVLIAPVKSSNGIAIVERDIVGVYDVQVAAHATLTPDGGRVDATTGTTALDRRWYCSLTHGGAPIRYIATAGCAASGFSCQPIGDTLFSEPVRDNVLLKFRTRRAENAPTQHCEVRHGVSAGDQAGGSPTLATDGRTGVFAANSDVRVDAIAIYTRATPCPAPVVR